MPSFLEIAMTDFKITRAERAVNAIFYALTHLLVRVEADELKKIPARGPVLLIINHVNLLEGPIVYTELQHLQPRPLTGFAKIEFWNNPITAFLFDLWDTIPLHRGEADLSAIKDAVARIKAGQVFAMAPEGTRSHDARLRRAHPGIAMLGYMSGAPIIPMVGYGHENYKSDLKHFHRPIFHIHVGQPFRLETGGQRVKKTMRQQMADEIMYRVAALLPEKYRGAYADLAQGTTEYLNFDVQVL